MAKKIDRLSAGELRALVRNKHEDVRLDSLLGKLHKESVHKRGHYLKQTTDVMDNYRNFFKTTGWSNDAEQNHDSHMRKSLDSQLKPWAYFTSGTIERWDQCIVQAKTRPQVDQRPVTNPNPAKKHLSPNLANPGRSKSAPSLACSRKNGKHQQEEYSQDESILRTPGEKLYPQIAGPDRHIRKLFRKNTEQQQKNDIRPKRGVCSSLPRPEKLSLDFLKMYIHPRDRYKTEDLFLFKRIAQLKRELAFGDIPDDETQQSGKVNVVFSQLSRKQALKDMISKNTTELKVEKVTADHSALDKKVDSFIQSIQQFCKERSQSS